MLEVVDLKFGRQADVTSQSNQNKKVVQTDEFQFLITFRTFALHATAQ
jgi:hypothetical protein